jgi:carboxylesterase type B
MLGHLKPGMKDKLPASIRSSLSSTPDLAEKLLAAYSFTDTSLSDDAYFTNFLNFCNDLSFYGATLSFAEGWPSSSKIYTFLFNEPNPWEGMHIGRATHVLDVVFLFQNHNHNLSPAQKDAAEKMGLEWMRFVAKKEPWEAYSKEKRAARVYGPSHGEGEGDKARSKVIDLQSAEGGRGDGILSVGREIGFDRLSEVVGRIRMGL